MEDFSPKEEKTLRAAIVYAKRKALFKQLEELEQQLPDIEEKRTRKKKLKTILFIIGLLILGLFSYWWYQQSNPSTEEKIFAAYFDPFSMQNKAVVTTDARTKAFNALEKEQYQLAETLFKEIYTDTADQSLLLWLGIAALGNDQPDTSISYLEQYLVSYPNNKNDVDWYIALAYLKKKDIESLKNAYENMEEGFMKFRVKNIIEQLK
ncbi:MAG: hypothetical protein AAF806_09375 [Bacteroidota bacterium]